jgi:hypothetical protein
MKLVYDQLPTRKHKSKSYEWVSSTCKHCDQPESFDHLMRCPIPQQTPKRRFSILQQTKRPSTVYRPPSTGHMRLPSRPPGFYRRATFPTFSMTLSLLGIRSARICLCAARSLLSRGNTLKPVFATDVLSSPLLRAWNPTAFSPDSSRQWGTNERLLEETLR